MPEHKHATVLRAIADGVPLGEFEVHAESWPPHEWIEASEDGSYTAWITSPDRWEIRRKPQYIMVNGFKVPKPLDVMPPLVFWPYVTYETLWDSASYGNSEAKRAFERKCAHGTKEAAIAHAKAMLGIDPEAL